MSEDEIGPIRAEPNLTAIYAATYNRHKSVVDAMLEDSAVKALARIIDRVTNTELNGTVDMEEIAKMTETEPSRIMALSTILEDHISGRMWIRLTNSRNSVGAAIIGYVGTDPFFRTHTLESEHVQAVQKEDGNLAYEAIVVPGMLGAIAGTRPDGTIVFGQRNMIVPSTTKQAAVPTRLASLRVLDRLNNKITESDLWSGSTVRTHTHYGFFVRVPESSGRFIWTRSDSAPDTIVVGSRIMLYNSDPTDKTVAHIDTLNNATEIRSKLEEKETSAKFCFNIYFDSEHIRLTKRISVAGSGSGSGSISGSISAAGSGSGSGIGIAGVIPPPPCRIFASKMAQRINSFSTQDAVDASYASGVRIFVVPPNCSLTFGAGSVICVAVPKQISVRNASKQIAKIEVPNYHAVLVMLEPGAGAVPAYKKVTEIITAQNKNRKVGLLYGYPNTIRRILNSEGAPTPFANVVECNALIPECKLVTLCLDNCIMPLAINTYGTSLTLTASEWRLKMKPEHSAARFPQHIAQWSWLQKRGIVPLVRTNTVQHAAELGGRDWAEPMAKLWKDPVECVDLERDPTCAFCLTAKTNDV